MIEFIINQYDDVSSESRQVGQLQFDRDGWTVDSAIEVLRRYLQRELADGPEMARAKTSHVEPKQTLSETKEDEAPAEGQVGVSSGQSRDIQVLDMYADGKKYVLRYRGKGVTGNILAGLVALYRLGGTAKQGSDIVPGLEEDGRFESTADDMDGAARHILRRLVTLGWVKEGVGGARAITEEGRRVAELFPILPRSGHGSFRGDLSRLQDS